MTDDAGAVWSAGLQSRMAWTEAGAPIFIRKMAVPTHRVIVRVNDIRVCQEHSAQCLAPGKHTIDVKDHYYCQRRKRLLKGGVLNDRSSARGTGFHQSHVRWVRAGKAKGHVEIDGALCVFSIVSSVTVEGDPCSGRTALCTAPRGPRNDARLAA